MKKSSFPLILPLLLSVLVWLPLLFLLAGSFMGQTELSENLAPILQGTQGLASWSLLPHFPTLRHYVELLLDSPEFFVMFWNSVKLAVLILLGQLLFGMPAAWGFAQFTFRGRSFLFTIYIVLMLMPFQVTMVSSYLVLDTLSLMDTHWAVVLPAVFSTFPVFLMYRFFCGISPSLLESAALDGAGACRTFLSIGIPLGMPGIMSAIVLGFLDYWNLVEQPLTFLKTKSLWPLSLYLPNISLSQAGIAFAASVVTLLPAILVFIYGQSYLEQGIIASGIKE
ncbi:MAG: carbohydrate ABC transporter permease [Angelakisella sp.]